MVCSPLTPPGTKLPLEGTVDAESTYLLLTNKNARVLGGKVSSLVETWEFKRVCDFFFNLLTKKIIEVLKYK
jgi:hypothetical protein